MYKRHCHYNKHTYWVGVLSVNIVIEPVAVLLFFFHLCELSTIQQNLAAAFSNFICLFSNSKRSSDSTIQWPLQMTLTSDLDHAYFCLFNLFFTNCWAKPFQIFTQASLAYGHSSDIIKSLQSVRLLFTGTLCFLLFCEHAFLA